LLNPPLGQPQNTSFVHDGCWPFPEPGQGPSTQAVIEPTIPSAVRP
jgi:hypothetical protein